MDFLIFLNLLIFFLGMRWVLDDDVLMYIFILTSSCPYAIRSSFRRVGWGQKEYMRAFTPSRHHPITRGDVSAASVFFVNGAPVAWFRQFLLTVNAKHLPSNRRLAVSMVCLRQVKAYGKRRSLKLKYLRTDGHVKIKP